MVGTNKSGGPTRQGRQVGLNNVPTLTVNIYAAATNKVNINNQLYAPPIYLLNEISMNYKYIMIIGGDPK